MRSGSRMLIGLRVRLDPKSESREELFVRGSLSTSAAVASSRERLNERGSIPLMVRETTIVVIKSLSAAGSMIDPNTVPILYFLASHPSTCMLNRLLSQVERNASVERRKMNVRDLTLLRRIVEK